MTIIRREPAVLLGLAAAILTGLAALITDGSLSWETAVPLVRLRLPRRSPIGAVASPAGHRRGHRPPATAGGRWSFSADVRPPRQ